MKIIEFYGVPGVGKSTLSDELEENLNFAGYSTINLQRLMSRNSVVDKVKAHLTYIFSYIAPMNWKLKKILYQYSGNMDEQKKYWIRQILLINYRISCNVRKFDYILLDEGIVQFLTSIWHLEQIKYPELLLQVFSSMNIAYRQNTVLFCCQLDDESVMKRIKERARTKDRFLTDDKFEFYKRIERKKENLELVSLASGFNIHYCEMSQEYSKLIIQIEKML